MTPLLTRLARRAAGLPLDPVVVAAAVLPSRFAPVAAVSDDAEVPAPAVTSPEAAARPGRAPGSRSRRHDDEHPAGSRAPVAAAPAGPTGPAPVGAPVGEPVTGRRATPVGPSTTGTVEPATPGAARPSRSEQPADVRPGARGARAARVASVAAPAAVRVSASPSVGAAPPRTATQAPRGQPEPAAREPDVVHVTIGRVEVRGPAPAPLPTPVPSASTGARGASGPEPLSLGDYLRGRREAR